MGDGEGRAGERAICACKITATGDFMALFFGTGRA